MNFLRFLLVILAATTTAATVAAQSARIDPIINGRAVTSSEYQGTVAVLDGSTLSVVCTGTLVTRRVVVTAGHCFFDGDGAPVAATSFAVGFSTLDLRSPPSTDHLVAVVGGGPHPEYGTSESGDERMNGLDPTERDIGVLLLARDLVEVPTVPLTSRSKTARVTDPGESLTLVGYGVTDLDTLDYGILMSVESTVVDRIENEMLLAPASVDEGDTCFGDSGGPVYATIDGTITLVGLTSRGRLDTTIECGAGGIYSNVAYHRAWLAEISGDETLAPPPSSDGGRCSAGPSGASAPFMALCVAGLGLALVRRRLRGS